MVLFYTYTITKTDVLLEATIYRALVYTSWEINSDRALNFKVPLPICHVAVADVDIV